MMWTSTLRFDRCRSASIVAIATASLSLVLAGCGGGNSVSGGTSSASGDELGNGDIGATGIQGNVLSRASTAGPTDPGTPLVGATVEAHACLVTAPDDPAICMDYNGVAAAQTTSSAAGAYSVAVPSGKYVVVGKPVATNGATFPRFEMDGSYVTVTSGQMASHDVVYDAGPQ